MTILTSGGKPLTAGGVALGSTPPPPTRFAAAFGHSATHPYLIYCDDVDRVGGPAWTNVVAGLPDRPIPGDEALRKFVADQAAPRDCIFGCLYDGASGNSEALWRNTSLRSGAAWTKVLGPADLAALVGNGSIASLTFGALATANGTGPGGTLVGAVAAFNGSGAAIGEWLVHSHDRGDTWTATAIVRTYGGDQPLEFFAGLGVSPDGATIHCQYVQHAMGFGYFVRSTDGGHTLGTAVASPDGAWWIYAPAVAGLPTVHAVPNSIYSVYERTSNGGATWASATAPFTGSAAVTGSPSDPTALIYYDNRGYTGPYRSTDDGASWTALPEAPYYVRVVRCWDGERLIASLAPRTIFDAFSYKIGGYDAATNAWTVWDGNLASIYGSDSAVGFCNFCVD